MKTENSKVSGKSTEKPIETSVSDQSNNENEYHESEDEDFKPDDIIQESDEDSDRDEEPSETKEALDKKYQSIQGDELFIKTRSQRREEQAAEKEYKTVTSNTTVDVDDIWKQLNQKTDSSTKTVKELPADEYIVIRRKYQFAGKMEEEEKRVLANSAEAKAYLAEQKPTNSIKRQPDNLPMKKRPTKKKRSFLQDELNAAKAQKMNTLQKSRLDWASFVDQEGIKDDLTKHNKGGYLHKQDFLSRVEHNLDQKRKEGLKKHDG